jgi:hypothetical protein
MHLHNGNCAVYLLPLHAIRLGGGEGGQVLSENMHPPVHVSC